MSNFERDIRDSLLPTSDEWRARAQEMNTMITETFEEKRRKAALMSWIGSGIGLAFMLLGLVNLFSGLFSGNATVAVAGAMFFLFGDGWMTGSKLLYWTWNSRLQVQRDIKEMHYDVLNVLTRLEAMESRLAAKE